MMLLTFRNMLTHLQALAIRFWLLGYAISGNTSGFEEQDYIFWFSGSVAIVHSYRVANYRVAFCDQDLETSPSAQVK